MTAAWSLFPVPLSLTIHLGDEGNNTTSTSLLLVLSLDKMADRIVKSKLITEKLSEEFVPPMSLVCPFLLPRDRILTSIPAP